MSGYMLVTYTGRGRVANMAISTGRTCCRFITYRTVFQGEEGIFTMSICARMTEFAMTWKYRSNLGEIPLIPLCRCLDDEICSVERGEAITSAVRPPASIINCSLVLPEILRRRGLQWSCPMPLIRNVSEPINTSHVKR